MRLRASRYSQLCLAFALPILGASAATAQPTGKKKPTVKKLVDCPLYGAEAKADTPHAILNIQKRKRVPDDPGTPVRITFDDLTSLEDAAEELGYTLGQHSAITKTQRKKLAGLHDVDGQPIGEGSYVELAAYVTDDAKNPRYNKGESVNCYLPKPADNDMHINVVADPEDDEFQGIVIEMVPQGRPQGWNVPALRAVRGAHAQVLIRGLLFFDNMHVKRTDCGEEETHATCVSSTGEAAGNPARVSLWEIHPVSTFKVCLAADGECDPAKSADWTDLESLTKAEIAKLKAKGHG